MQLLHQNFNCAGGARSFKPGLQGFLLQHAARLNGELVLRLARDDVDDVIADIALDHFGVLPRLQGKHGFFNIGLRQHAAREPAEVSAEECVQLDTPASQSLHRSAAWRNRMRRCLHPAPGSGARGCARR